jgi:uncharacterized RDD family membrane protein YckC
VYQTCPNCKTLNRELATECYACGEPLVSCDPEGEPVAVPVSEPDWREEVARRLEAYRARRRSIRADAEQDPLPFAREPVEWLSGHEESASHSAAPRNSRARGPLKIAIELEQPELDFLAAEESSLHPDRTLATVAGLGERGRAGMLDAVFVCLAFTCFLLIFRYLGGELVLGKLPLAIYGGALFSLYLLYFGLFTFFTGVTPGMHLLGLQLVSFAGESPGERQRLWRCFGYALSGLSLLFGFLWAVWDEDGLTWQDRISQTYLTPSNPAAAFEQRNPGAGQ